MTDPIDTARLRELLAMAERSDAADGALMTAYPALLDEIDRLRAELAEARRGREQIVKWMHSQAEALDVTDLRVRGHPMDAEMRRRDTLSRKYSKLADAIERGEHRSKTDGE